MRRVCVSLVCCLLVQIALPPSALAWWGWWDELSGPGKFRGFQIDTRVLCFGSRPNPNALAQLAAGQAAAANDDFLTVKGSLPAELRTAVDSPESPTRGDLPDTIRQFLQSLPPDLTVKFQDTLFEFPRQLPVAIGQF